MCTNLEECPVHHRIEHGTGKNWQRMILRDADATLSPKLQMYHSWLVAIESRIVAIFIGKSESASNTSIETPVCIAVKLVIGRNVA